MGAGDHPSVNAVADVLQPCSCAAYPGARAGSPRTRPRPHGLLGLAPGGVCRAGTVTDAAVSSCLTVSPSPISRQFVFCGTVPRVSPGGRYPPPCPVEPGLSSTDRRLPRSPRVARPNIHSSLRTPLHDSRWGSPHLVGADVRTSRTFTEP